MSFKNFNDSQKDNACTVSRTNGRKQLQMLAQELSIQPFENQLVKEESIDDKRIVSKRNNDPWLKALSSCWMLICSAVRINEEESLSVLFEKYMRKRLRERFHGLLYYPGKSPE